MNRVSTGFMQVMPCKHCGRTGYHLWAGSGFCPGLTEGVDELYKGKMPESMYYYQLGFKHGYDTAERHDRTDTDSNGNGVAANPTNGKEGDK